MGEAAARAARALALEPVEAHAGAPRARALVGGAARHVLRLVLALALVVPLDELDLVALAEGAAVLDHAEVAEEVGPAVVRPDEAEAAVRLPPLRHAGDALAAAAAAAATAVSVAAGRFGPDPPPPPPPPLSAARRCAAAAHASRGRPAPRRSVSPYFAACGVWKKL